MKAEWSVSANDATNRFVLAAVLQLPVGRGDLIGGKMNRSFTDVEKILLGGGMLRNIKYGSGSFTLYQESQRAKAARP